MSLDPLTLLNGDCRAMLATLPAASVQCCVTSPPYYGLRDYGVAGQIGMEETPEEFLAEMVAVFEGVRRVLRDDGTLWLNLGDSYASNAGGYDSNGSRGASSWPSIGTGTQKAIIKNSSRIPPSGYKQKDLMGIPWRVAFALQAAGWYLRSEIIWHKPNPMPESVTDRPTKAHEHIFLLSKTVSYYYDQEAILEPCSESTHARLAQNVAAQIGSERANGGANTNGNMKAVSRKLAEPGSGVKNNASMDAALAIMPTHRNKRSVWTVPTAAYKDAHFATFPPDLIKPCILAGTKPGDVVLDPFGGSGTTGMVALELGRRATLIELNPDYCALIRQRCAITPGLALA